MQIALTFNPQRQPSITAVQVSDTQPFPSTVVVGDYIPRQGWIVALISNITELTDCINSLERLKQVGAHYDGQQQHPPYRYYLVCRFTISQPRHATTVTEKLTLSLLGEAETARVIGFEDEPSPQVYRAVWEALEARGLLTTEGETIKGEPLDGSPVNTMRNVDLIDTDSDTNQGWLPMPTQVIDNPVITVTSSI